ncbi:hypothetical protein DASB73_016740 [Starmerella bacillaris]|uniref:Inhibitor I9 domain-containing protein n=1 Tax=Starmerella bacillaris TaxID=1247836 RepID=A0AAV5RGJ3_STABA|nr:hypothetical protein DASB73_016740 [Starmerella bacillaris]
MSSKYIVRLKEDATEDELNNSIKSFESSGGTISRHHTLFKGFTGEIPDNKITAFEATPGIEAVEKDQTVHIN